MVTQETIIYRLVVRNHDFDVFFEKTLLWQENDGGRHSGANRSAASRLDQKVGPMGGPFGSTVISKVDIKHQIFSFDILYERAPEDEQVEKKRV